MVVLELWVFWFDDRHTGLIDDHLQLKELKEQKVGSFNWDQVMSNGLSPTDSPRPNRSVNEHISLTPNSEYMLFIKSIRNLIHNAMTKSGAFTLGEFFIFPDIEDDDIIDSVADQSKASTIKSTMIAFMYNVYLTSSNLVFQPNTRRMRIRSLTAQDIYIKNKKVLLCPTGEHATLISFQSLPTPELQRQVLEQWADFYQISCAQLVPSSSQHFPSLVTIRSSSGDIITYPSMLVFVPTDTKLSPSAVAGLNGIMGLNHGLTEDLGSKVSRSAYHQSLQPNVSSIDYWSYRDPIIYASNVMIDSLSMMDTNYQQDQLLLHRALIEPVVPSPIMTSKSVIPINTTPLLGNAIPSDYKAYTTPPKSSVNSSMNLIEFTKHQFQIDDEPVEAILDSLNPLDDPNVMVQENKSIDNADQVAVTKTDDDISLLAQSNQAISNTENLQQQDIAAMEQPIDNFNLIYNDGIVARDAWDEDFADLDLDVTEADFDFFKTPAPAADNVLNIIPIQEEPKNPPIIIEQTVDDDDVVMKDTPNNDSLFTPFVVSQDGSERGSVESSSGHVTVESNDLSMSQKKTYQKITPAHDNNTCFVPRDFLPVPINTATIDAKYEPGGKFMYPASKENVHHLKRELYSPDYVPTTNKKAMTKLAVENVQESNTDVEMTDVKQESNSSSTSESSSSNSSSSSSSSSGSSSSDDDDSNSEDSGNDSVTIEQMVDKRLRSLKKFQKSVVYSLLKATPASLPTDRFQNIDYDTPFASVLASDSYIKPIKWRQSKAMEESIEYLCQQAVWGGYPFTGGLAEVSENGGEFEVESSKVLMARRTNIMQMTRGVVTHVPSLQTDANRLTIRFKNTLKHVFLRHRSFENDDVHALVEEEISMRPNAYAGNPVLGSIDVKGPLTIQQYYSLNETHHQTHSKYGKYQIKKKRPDQPNFNSLKQPDIVVSRNEDFLEGSPKMLTFWEKLGLEPCSSKKQLKYLVMYPENRDIEASVTQFFKNLSTVYDTCHLGKHMPGHIGPYRHGLVPVPLSAAESNETSVKSRLKSYEETCEDLGRNLAIYDGDHPHQNLIYTVIYMVNPGPHMSSYLDMCRCFYKLKSAYVQVSGRNDQSRIELQMIPIDHILRSSAFSGYTLLGMKDIAFSVYTKCFEVVSRKKNLEIITDLYAPPFILSKPIPKKIQYKLNDIRAFPILLDQDANLHMAYCFSYDRVWMAVVWTDSQGELLEYALFPRKTAYRDAWERTLKIAKRTDFPWTIVITKVGLMFNDEYLHWMRYVSNSHKYWITIIGIDLETGLNLHFNTSPMDTSTGSDKNQLTPTLLNSSGNSQTTRGYVQEKNTQNSHIDMMFNEAQSLVLNHRISYSQKRERAYKGILRTEAITEKERWMSPLATGYLIHHPIQNKNLNPCIEQFNNEPFVAEIHLLYNHTQHSAYITLQDIIKRLYSLSFINPIPSNHSCIPFHVVLAERLSRLLLIVDDSLK
ncbi:mediator complex subunit 13 C-terminal-domain-containing protein [Thamnidium elegans]|nr:mediator complex subunit 13 C-terminal-domain-containing protein [Thamnidium elegans]